jgi:hypothetical protein
MLWLTASVALLAVSTAFDSSWRFVPLGCSAIAAIVSMERMMCWGDRRARRLRERSGKK